MTYGGINGIIAFSVRSNYVLVFILYVWFYLGTQDRDFCILLIKKRINFKLFRITYESYLHSLPHCQVF